MLVAQFAAMMFVGGVSFLVTVYVARNVGPQAYGAYTSALAAGALISIFIDGGMRTLILREHTRASIHLQENSLDLPGYALGHTLWSSGVLIILVLLFFQDEYLRLALATVGCFLSLTLIQFTSACMRGEGSLVADFRFQVGARTTSAVLIVFCVSLGYKAPWQILAGWALAGFIYLFLFYSSYWQPPRLVGLAKIYRSAFPFVVLDLAITVYIRTSLILLNFFGVEPNLIGQFAAAFRICEAVIMLASPLGLLTFRYYRTKNYSIQDARKPFSRVLGAVFIFSIVGMILVWMASNQIVEWLFGHEYQDTAGILRIFALMLVFVLPNTLLSQVALALDKNLVTILASVLVRVVIFIFFF